MDRRQLCQFDLRAPGRFAQIASLLSGNYAVTELKRAGPLMDTLLADYGLFHLEADLHWIDTTTARLGELAALLTRGATPGPPERVRTR